MPGTALDSPQRFEAFKSAAEAAGVKVQSVHWTQGAYDIVLITGPVEARMTLVLKTAALGNLRTQTLCGYNVAEMREFAATCESAATSGLRKAGGRRSEAEACLQDLLHRAARAGAGNQPCCYRPTHGEQKKRRIG